MICFNCPNCHRYYELPDALRNLPLLCKGCGQRLELPEPTLTPPPAKNLIGRDDPVTPVVNPPQPIQPPVQKPVEPQTTLPESVDQPSQEPLADEAVVLATKKPIPPATRAGEPDNMVPPVSKAETVEASLPKWRARPWPVLVDAMIGFILIIVGGLLGEVLARKSTADVWEDAGSAPKFPPIDLLMWLTPPVLLCLVYWLLVTRRKSLGGWLQRRSET